MPKKADEPRAPLMFGLFPMRLESADRHRRVFRLGKMTVYNWRTRTDWMGAHDDGIWVSAGERSTPQKAAGLLARKMRRVYEELGRTLPKLARPR